MEALRGLNRMMALMDQTKDKTARKLAKAGVNAGLTPLAAAMRSAVNAAPISPGMKASARATIAKRLLKKEGQPTVGKAGFGVGKRSAKKTASAHERNMAGQGGGGSLKGVGISAANIHWPVLGTGHRMTGMRTWKVVTGGRVKETGNRMIPTGKMPALLQGLLDGAASKAAPAMLAAAQKKVSEVLASEIAKTRKA